MRVLAQNRKARYEYEILAEYDAGLVLLGSEIKSLRQGKANIGSAYCYVDKNSEVFILNMNITPYSATPKYLSHDPLRKRKLLLTKREINRINGNVKEKGNTIIPLLLYLSDKNLAKLKIALARGKKLYDKRRAIKEREWNREKDIIMKKHRT